MLISLPLPPVFVSSMCRRRCERITHAPLWTELFLANKNELLNHIESFEKSLDKLKKQIQDEENKNLQENLELVRSKRILMVENTRK